MLSQLQTPALQTFPFCEPQLLPQPPQLASFSVTSVSQPSSAPVVGLEQFPLPEAQKDEQALPVQARLATPAVEHFRSHAPQFARSSCTARSQPGAPLSQSPKPLLQAPTAHAPDAQVAVAFGTEHAAQVAPAHPVAGLSIPTQRPAQSFCDVVQDAPSPVPVSVPESPGPPPVAGPPPAAAASPASVPPVVTPPPALESLPPAEPPADASVAPPLSEFPLAPPRPEVPLGDFVASKLSKSLVHDVETANATPTRTSPNDRKIIRMFPEPLRNARRRAAEAAPPRDLRSNRSCRR